MDLHDARTDYTLDKLSRKDLETSPVSQFKKWFEEVSSTGFRDPSAMIVATVDSSGQPSQRYVLLKQFDEQGFVFFTDTSSTKGKEIEQNKRVSLLFPWHFLERQVRIQGQVESLDRASVEEYFHSRPQGSQLAAASSNQSQEATSRTELESSFNSLAEQYGEGQKVPLPERWGGYRVIPNSFEFWQGGEHRLHDRFTYQRNGENWAIKRLQP